MNHTSMPTTERCAQLRKAIAASDAAGEHWCADSLRAELNVAEARMQPGVRKYSEDDNENLAYRVGFGEGLHAGRMQDTGQPERELVSLLKDVLHCSDVFATFRPDIHTRLLDFGRRLREQQRVDEFREVEPA
jgi:hypothetical protein